jgi:hypothetical protein
MEIVKAKITDIDQNGITIFAPYQNVDRAILRQYNEVQVGLPDGRYISPEQRRKAYALMNEIAEWMGELPEFVKRLMKIEFVTNRLQALHKQIFSLADCDMTTAREFITFLIDFILEHDIPVSVPLYQLSDDIGRYVYACLMRKKCAICGKKPELHHHEDKVGMGRDRTEILHIDMRVLPLCPEHHTEAHSVSVKAFNEKYHMFGIPLTVEIGKKYGLSKKNLGVTA